LAAKTTTTPPRQHHDAARNCLSNARNCLSNARNCFPTRVYDACAETPLIAFRIDVERSWRYSERTQKTQVNDAFRARLLSERVY